MQARMLMMRSPMHWAPSLARQEEHTEAHMWLLLASPLEGLGHGSSQKAPDKHRASKIGGAGAGTKQKGAAGGVGQGCPSLVLIYWLQQNDPWAMSVRDRTAAPLKFPELPGVKVTHLLLHPQYFWYLINMWSETGSAWASLKYSSNISLHRIFAYNIEH